MIIKEKKIGTKSPIWVETFVLFFSLFIIIVGFGGGHSDVACGCFLGGFEVGWGGG